MQGEPYTVPVPLTYDELESVVEALEFQMSASHDDDIHDLRDKLRGYLEAARDAH